MLHEGTTKVRSPCHAARGRSALRCVRASVLRALVQGVALVFRRRCRRRNWSYHNHLAHWSGRAPPPSSCRTQIPNPSVRIDYSTYVMFILADSPQEPYGRISETSIYHTSRAILKATRPKASYSSGLPSESGMKGPTTGHWNHFYTYLHTHIPMR